MTRERAKELLPVIQAFAVGKKIQRLCTEPDVEHIDKWVDCLNPKWCDQSNYRIKPEPREFWLELTARGAVVAAYDIKPQDRGYHCIKVREVVE